MFASFTWIMDNVILILAHCMFKHENSKNEIESMQMQLHAMEETLDTVLEIANVVENCEGLEKQIRIKDLKIENNLQKAIEVLETKITKFIESNAIEKDKEDTHTDNIDYE